MDDRVSILGPLAELFYAMFAGAETELRCFDALEAVRRTHPWVLGVRESTPEEDYRGYDYLVQTDVGEARIQVKRSEFEAQRFIARNPYSGILVLVILPYWDEGEVLAYVAFRLTSWRKHRIANMPKWRPELWGSIAAYSALTG